MFSCVRSLKSNYCWMYRLCFSNDASFSLEGTRPVTLTPRRKYSITSLQRPYAWHSYLCWLIDFLWTKIRLTCLSFENHSTIIRQLLSTATYKPLQIPLAFHDHSRPSRDFTNIREMDTKNEQTWTYSLWIHLNPNS